MTRRLAPVLALLLGALAVLGLVRLAGWLPARALELGATRLIEPDPELVAYLRAAEEPLHVTWFVTSDEAQPAERRALGDQVAELLERLRRAAPGRLDFARADPAADPDLARYAARRGVASFRAGGVRGDAGTSSEVHATLLLERGLARPARLEHLGPEHLPILQALLLERLRESDAATLPRVLLVRPDPRSAEFTRLASHLAERCDLRVIAGDAWTSGPDALWPDLTLWIAPGPEAVPAEVERYLESGRSLVLAEPGRAPALLQDLGLLAGPVPAPSGAAPALGPLPLGPAPLTVTSIAPDQDFRLLSDQPDGSLRFDDPVHFRFDAAALDRRGVSGRHLATTPEREDGPKLGLVALLDPVDPRTGSVVALGSATPLSDAGLDPSAEPGAHLRLVDILVTSFTDADRRVLLRALPEPPERLVRPGASTRWLVRAALWLPLPLLLLALARRRARRSSAPRGPVRRVAPDAALALGVVVLLAVAWPAAGARWASLDWTRGRLATPSPVLAAIAADLADEIPGGGLHAQLVLSSPGRLPLGLRLLERRTLDLLDACAAAGLDLTVERLEPERQEPEQLATLEARGVAPFHHDLGGARTQAWASLVLTAGSVELVLDFAEGREAEELEFRLALALERLRGGRDPVLGLATDLPRMSAAEDYEFQSRGSFAPREGDVFGLARRGLERAGFEVRHVNPRDPAVASADLSALDALLWLQPRRELRPMLDALAGHLVRGGRALVAAQHYRTQGRQYRGADFEQVFWPQPQLADLDRFYLPELGLELERRLLMDRLTAELPLQARQTESAESTTFETRAERQPFLLRVPTAQFADDLRLAGASDLGLPDPSRVLLDGARLAELGLTAQPLLWASPEAWTVDWQGGWLTEAMLAGPGAAPEVPPEAGGEPEAAPEAAPAALLAVELRGCFPPPTDAWDDYTPISADLAVGEQPGRLVLLGASAFLTDPLLAGAYRGDGLLLGLAADLALERFGPHGPGLAELAARRPISPGFASPTPRARGLARVAVIGGGGLALALLALLLRRTVRTPAGLEPAAPEPRAGARRSPRTPSAAPARGPSLPRRLALPALLAAAAWGSPAALALVGLGSSAAPPGGLTFGRLVPPELRARPLAAVRIARAPAADAPRASWTYAYQGGLWRELEGLGALGDGPRLQALVEGLFESEGRVVHPGTGDLTGWQLEPENAWRIELFEAPSAAPSADGSDPGPAELLARLGEPYLAVEVGLQTREGTDSWARVDGSPALWQLDRSVRPLLDPTWRAGGPQALPPLFDAGLVPASWPGRRSGLELVAWQRLGAKSLRLVRTPVERTPEELRAGLAPLAWRLVGDGEPRLLADGLDAAAADALLSLVTSARATELLDPAQLAAYGFDGRTPPTAILLIQAAASEEFPGGLALNLEVGPLLPPELGGGHAVVHAFTGNLVRVPAELVEALLPPRAAFDDPSWTRRWQLLRQDQAR